jgi:hypothetical protein
MTLGEWLLLSGAAAFFAAAAYAWRALEQSDLQDINVEDIHIGQPVRYNGRSTPAELRQAQQSAPAEEKRSPTDPGTIAKKPTENGHST